MRLVTSTVFATALGLLASTANGLPASGRGEVAHVGLQPRQSQQDGAARIKARMVSSPEIQPINEPSPSPRFEDARSSFFPRTRKMEPNSLSIPPSPAVSPSWRWPTPSDEPYSPRTEYTWSLPPSPKWVPTTPVELKYKKSFYDTFFHHPKKKYAQGAANFFSPKPSFKTPYGTWTRQQKLRRVLSEQIPPSPGAYSYSSTPLVLGSPRSHAVTPLRSTTMDERYRRLRAKISKSPDFYASTPRIEPTSHAKNPLTVDVPPTAAWRYRPSMRGSSALSDDGEFLGQFARTQGGVPGPLQNPGPSARRLTRTKSDQGLRRSNVNVLGTKTPPLRGSSSLSPLPTTSHLLGSNTTPSPPPIAPPQKSFNAPPAQPKNPPRVKTKTRLPQLKTTPPSLPKNQSTRDSRTPPPKTSQTSQGTQTSPVLASKTPSPRVENTPSLPQNPPVPETKTPPPQPKTTPKRPPPLDIKTSQSLFHLNLKSPPRIKSPRPRRKTPPRKDVKPKSPSPLQKASPLQDISVLQKAPAQKGLSSPPPLPTSPLEDSNTPPPPLVKTSPLRSTPPPVPKPPMHEDLLRGMGNMWRGVRTNLPQAPKVRVPAIRVPAIRAGVGNMWRGVRTRLPQAPRVRVPAIRKLLHKAKALPPWARPNKTSSPNPNSNARPPPRPKTTSPDLDSDTYTPPPLPAVGKMQSDSTTTPHHLNWISPPWPAGMTQSGPSTPHHLKWVLPPVTEEVGSG